MERGTCRWIVSNSYGINRAISWHNLLNWLLFGLLGNHGNSSKLSMIISLSNDLTLRSLKLLRAYKNRRCTVRWSKRIIWLELILIGWIPMNQWVSSQAVQLWLNEVASYMLSFGLHRGNSEHWWVNDILMLVNNYIGMTFPEFVCLVGGDFGSFKCINSGLFAVLSGDWVVSILDCDLLERILKFLIDFIFFLLWTLVINSCDSVCGGTLLIAQEECEDQWFCYWFHF